MELTDGRYRARGVQGALGRTKGGAEQVAVEFELLDEEGNPGPHITWFGYFTDKTFERTIESLRHCGWEGDDLSDLSGVSANEVSLVIESEEYEGKTIPRVRWVNAPGGGLALKDQLSPDEARAFAAQMRGRIVGMGKGQRRNTAASGGRSRTGAIPPEPPPHGDSDIPF